MNTLDPIRVLRFEKRYAHDVLYCEMQVFEDGSAYVRGDEIEIGFEETSDAWQEGIAYLESRGYVRIAETAR